jgi:hypothetical protein
MDPTTILAGVSALLQSIQTWYQVRDSRRASETFSGAYEITLKSHLTGRMEIFYQAEMLENIVPKPVLLTMGKRLEKCWTRYHAVLEGDFLPAEIDEATQNVKRCVCRELSRLAELTGGEIPTGILSEWWTTYCQQNR